MLKNNIIEENACIALHNWGEPLINPYFKDIVRVIRDLDLRVSFSTNASVFVDLSDEILLNNCDNIIISTCGNSQESYNKAHGFSFEKIQDNIVRLQKTFLKSGFKNSVHLTIHLYRYNVHEVSQIVNFANTHKMSYNIIPASFNSLETTLQYLHGTLPDEVLAKATEELFLPSLALWGKMKSVKYVCPQYNYLALTSSGMLSLCCGARLDKNDEIAIAPITTLTLDDINRMRRNHATCKLCQNLGMHYFGHEYHKFAKEITGLSLWDSPKNVSFLGTIKNVLRKFLK